MVQRYYELQLGVPVGDLPREADLLLLRRTGTGDLPFQGLWRYLPLGIFWNSRGRRSRHDGATLTCSSN